MKGILKGKDAEIIDLYNAGLGCDRISQKLSCNSESIRLLLKRNDIKLRKPSSYRKRLLDEAFFDTIDREDKAWLLGFILADGSVSSHSRGNYLSIELAIEDVEILNKISNLLKCGPPVITKRNTCSVRECSKRMFASLNSLGIYENKTQVGTPDIRNRIPEDLHRHFLRGIFDGDGWVTQDNKHSPIFGILGQEEAVNGLILDMCDELKIRPPKIYRRKTVNGPDICQWQIGGRDQVGRIYEYLYSDATIWLDRKREKMKLLLEKGGSGENVDDKS